MEYVAVLLLTIFRAANTQPVLEVPTRIFVSESLRKNMGDEQLFEIIKTSADALYSNTGILLDYERVIIPIPEIPYADPRMLGKSIPRRRNTLAIILTDAQAYSSGHGKFGGARRARMVRRRMGYCVDSFARG